MTYDIEVYYNPNMKNITQEELAEILAVSQPRISQIKAGNIIPWPIAEKLAILFHHKTLVEWRYSKYADITKAFTSPQSMTAKRLVIDTAGANQH